jgi:hypothetical protein
MNRAELEDLIYPYWHSNPVWKEVAVPDGWVDLVGQLVNDLEPFGDMRITQIKSKFGGLRFYVVGADERQNQLILDAEEKSTGVCEMCGRAGAAGAWWRKYWVETLCPTHQTTEPPGVSDLL